MADVFQGSLEVQEGQQHLNIPFHALLGSSSISRMHLYLSAPPNS